MYVHTKENRERFNRALSQQMKAELAISAINNNDVAACLCISRSTLYKYLSMDTIPTTDITYGFCRVVDVPFARFANRVVDRMEP